MNVNHSVVAPEPDSEEAGEGRVIATGVDDLGELYRSHQPKRLWPKNSKEINYEVLVLNGPDLLDSIDPLGRGVPHSWASKGYIYTQLPYGSTGQSAGQAVKLSFNNNLSFNNTALVDLTPAKQWDILKKRAKSNLRGGTWPNATIIHVHAHGDGTSLQVSSLPGTSDHGASWLPVDEGQLRDSRGEVENDYALSAAPNLEGVANFHTTGCGTMIRADGDRMNYVADARDVAAYVCFSRGAKNSVGYKAAIWYVWPTTRGYKTGQAWFNCFYQFGMLNKSGGPHYNATGYHSMVATEYEWRRVCEGTWGINRTDVDGLGYPHWVVSRPNQPLIDATGR